MKQKTRFKKSEIINRLSHSIRTLFKQDAFLLENNANERSISHKLAEYLQQQFPDYNVDCEYNRHGSEIKELDNRKCKRTDRVLPDILVHLRGHDENNLIVIEVKTRDNNEDCDIEKLKLFTKQSDKNKYMYEYGFFIRFDGLKEPELRLFQNGKEVNETKNKTQENRNRNDS